MPYIFDAILLIFFILFVVSGARNGFIRTVLGLLRGIVSFLAAIFVGNYLANLLFENVVRERLVNNFSEVLSEKGSREAALLWDRVPRLYRMISENSGMTRSGFEEAVKATAKDVAEGGADVLRPAAVLLMTFILAVVLFILFFVLMGILIRLVDKIFKLPVLSEVNHLMGAIAGAAGGLAAIFILCFLAENAAALLPVSAASFLARSLETSYIMTFYDMFGPLVLGQRG